MSPVLVGVFVLQSSVSGGCPRFIYAKTW